MARSSARGTTPRPIVPRATGKVNLVQFVGEVISELKKATWPTREETIRLTYIVLLISASVGVFLWAVDKGFFEMFRTLVFR